MGSFRRKRLGHRIPDWVKEESVYFVTINCRKRGTDKLSRSSVAKTVFAATRHYEGEGFWHARIMLLMPDHLHALISFNRHMRSMASTVRAFKSYLAKTQAIDWQRGFFDHRLRSQTEIQLKAHYIRMNPVRADLCASPEDWPHVIG